MTAQWVKYDGSYEQIAELRNAKNGYLLKNVLNKESDISNGLETNSIRRGEDKPKIMLYCSEVTHYWIIPDDPLREMKIRWSMTGQPVWVKEGKHHRQPFVYVTTTPDWNIANAEYSFTEFKEKV